jgi:hypothetical protein
MCASKVLSLINCSSAIFARLGAFTGQSKKIHHWRHHDVRPEITAKRDHAQSGLILEFEMR